MNDLLSELKKETVNQKLLEYGLFAEKLTAIFTSKDYGVWIRKSKTKFYQNKSFSTVKYRLTRNDNVPRIIDIPHPIAYHRLCSSLTTHWKKISTRIGEIADYAERSMVTPKPNNLNHRLVSMMAYDKRDDEKFLILDKSANNKYLIHADIANCYPSVYSHSIPWALVGHQVAKATILARKKWYNQIDYTISSMQRNETIGIPIGPDTSSIIIELVLSRVDKALKKFKYIRFIDDYRCYCKSQTEVDDFLQTLSRELEKYHFRLNAKKTKIYELPRPLGENWVLSLKNYQRHFLKKGYFTDRDINTISEFLDLAIRLAKENPSESPIRYAVRILSSKTFKEEKVFAFVVMYLSRICFIYPYFIDLFENLLDRNKENITKDIFAIVEAEINSLTKEHIKYSRSDVALWGIHLAIKYGLTLKYFEKYSNQLLEDGDCLPSLLCFKYAKKNKIKVDKYYLHIPNLISENLQDEWWIYIYELYREKSGSPTMKKISYKDFYEAMRKENITFIR
jgi:Reverse transcriptase (RNA-dependent DNA polymerase)